MSIDELLIEAEKNKVESLVLTDINNTSACLNFIRDASKHNVKPIVGIDFRNGAKQQFVGIAINNKGFQELNKYLTYLFHNNLKVSKQAPEFENAYVIYPFAKYDFNRILNYNEYVGVNLKQLQRINISGSAVYDQTKFVLLHPVTFRGQRDFNSHRLLRAIDNNTLLSKLELVEQADLNHKMLHVDEIKSVYKDYLHVLKNTERILDRCEIHFELGLKRNKTVFSDSAHNDVQLLRQKAEEGLSKRYSKVNSVIRNRLETELKVISELDFCSYFLMNWDIVRYAKSKNYPHVGRGSGANSIIAYLIGITNVDPVELNLYFERFINPYRATPPDFDIDFNWTDRDDITDYIFKKHGSEHVSLLGAYITFQRKSVIREIGKVFGLPSFEIDKLQKASKNNPIDELGKVTLKYSKLISEFPSHLSIHSSGILISESPINDFSATTMPPKGFPTCQFSMLEAEDIGLHKFDILSQRGLGKIYDTVKIVKKNKNVDIDIHDFKTFKKDEKVKQLLRTGEAIGCFYVESPAMRMLLTKLKADDYIRLVAASSIIRPGVSKSGMMREYILRYQSKEKREKAKKELPELYSLLEETYGVMVYQEDVIKVAHYFGGLTLAEADHLRRGMSWKFRQRSDFWKAKDSFFNNCINKGYQRSLIQGIWNQIESFANYAFAKGHSASYAIESYQALYLKAYYPIEYMVATLNNHGGFYRPEVYLHEAKKHGAILMLPCVNKSREITIVEDITIYLGLRFIGGLEGKSVNEICLNRSEGGSFLGLEDFVDRVSISLEQLVLLIRSESFKFTGKGKKELLWEVHMLLSSFDERTILPQLFKEERKYYELPVLENNRNESIMDEIELLGFTLHSPFKMVKEEITTQLTSNDLINFVGHFIQIVGYLVTVKTTMTSKGDLMFFGTFLDLKGNWLDTVHFPPSAKKHPFRGVGCYLLKGKVMDEFSFITIEVAFMSRLNSINADDL